MVILYTSCDTDSGNALFGFFSFLVFSYVWSVSLLILFSVFCDLYLYVAIALAMDVLSVSGLIRGVASFDCLSLYRVFVMYVSMRLVCI